ncbi:hypothetical protein ACM66B_006224 [Microbotryomycetes sp. NB124-2]
MIGPLLRAQLTAMLTKKLLESPSFHRLVGATHSSIDRLQQSAYDTLARAVAEGEAKMPPAARSEVFRHASDAYNGNSTNSTPSGSNGSASYSTNTSSSAARARQQSTRPRWKDIPERDNEAQIKSKKEIEQRQKDLQSLLDKLKQPPPPSA